ncbi:uncharacterized protein LOC144950306 [Lampetra fluviatilis]
MGDHRPPRTNRKSRNVDNADSDDGLSPTSSAMMSLKKQESQYHKLFPSIPQQELLLETYSCALKKDFLYHGKMFISQNWICFHSRIIHKQLQTRKRVPAAPCVETSTPDAAARDGSPARRESSMGAVCSLPSRVIQMMSAFAAHIQCPRWLLAFAAQFSARVRR